MNIEENELFINKFQPIYFKDFDCDNEMIDILESFILIDNLNLLLIGDIASGKTSILNSIIKEYYKDYSYTDYVSNILYINNLKEQGINYYRNDVKTFCQTCSIIKNKKKIIVLDDIDMINEQSQQVFRNCIDKFNNKVHFIASCSNIQKVIENIQSRFNIIKLKPIQREILVKILQKIKINQNIIIDEDAEELIINLSNNTVKVLINYMEKFKLLNTKITLSLAMRLCSNISFITFQEYTSYVKAQQLDKAIKIIYDLYDQGYSVIDIFDNYFLFMKSTTILSEDDKYKIIPFLCKYITIFHNIHEDEIELALFTNNLINILHT